MPRLLRLAAMLAMLAMAGTLSACAVYPRETVAIVPGHAHWVPGHYNAWGYWRPGHWV